MYIKIEDFLGVLSQRSTARANSVAANQRKVVHGLLPVGLKLHFTDLPTLYQHTDFGTLIQELGGKKMVLDLNFYRTRGESLCLVLPPVGNAETAILFLEAIEEYSKCSLFNNPGVQLQVCSPGRLNNGYAGLLTLCFYLGSDILRGHSLSELETTFSDSEFLPRGRRITIYDGNGALDKDFVWWGRKKRLWLRPKLKVSPRLHFNHERTDVLACKTRIDIRNVNLLATLLVHAHYHGYWQMLGWDFVERFRQILSNHQLGGHLSASWVYKNRLPVAEEDQRYNLILNEVMGYALAEGLRIKRTGKKGGILFEVQQLIADMRHSILTQVHELERSRGEPR